MTDLSAQHQRWSASPRRGLTLDRPRLIGILNLTPDSFSDGGRLPTTAHALQAASDMIAAGADAIDVGGESTRPGARPVPVDEQIARVVPVIAAIRAGHPEVIISIDTTQSRVAEAALHAGADAINDVSAGDDSPDMFALAARMHAGLVLMHRRVAPASDQFSHQYSAQPSYDHPDGVLGVVRDLLADRLRRALNAGVEPARLVIDPGLGFGKSVAQNLELIRRTPDLLSLGAPVLSACSRKSFTGALIAPPGSSPPPPSERLIPTLALSVLHLTFGARLFRVHDVKPHAEALAAAWALVDPR